MKEEKYVIAYASDDRYAMQTGVSLYSFLLHNTDVEWLIYIFSDGITEDNKKKLKWIASKFSCEIRVIEIPDLNQLAGNKLAVAHWAKAAYCRIFFEDLVPKEIKKVLYLDCDTIIVANLDDIFKEDMDAYPCAAVLDAGSAFKKEHGFKRKDYYFNTGVLLVNLEYWRKHNILQYFIEEFNHRNGNSIDVDQSYINCILKNKIKKLHPRYNVMHKVYAVLDSYNTYLENNGFEKGETYSETEFKEALFSPAIFHFTGNGLSRPWFYECTHPEKELWLKYQKETPWADCKLQSLNEISKSSADSYLCRLIYKVAYMFRLTRNIYIKRKYGFWLRNYDKLAERIN